MGGWISGACVYDRNLQRSDKFIADHPEWSIVYVASMDSHEASSGTTDAVLMILYDKSLGQLTERLEAEYDFPPEEPDSDEYREASDRQEGSQA